MRRSENLYCCVPGASDTVEGLVEPVVAPDVETSALVVLAKLILCSQLVGVPALVSALTTTRS